MEKLGYQSGRGAVTALAAVVMVAVAFGFGNPGDGGGVPGAPAVAEGQPQDMRGRCTHDVEIVISAAPDSLVRTIPVAGPISNVPEFHDCQRMVHATGAFGTLAGIWVAWNLQQLVDSLEFYRTQGGEPRMALSFAEIYAWDSAYAPLAISREFNCLYMRLDVRPGQAGRWRAWMKGVGTDAGSCLTPIRPEEAGASELRVQPLTYATPTGHNIPSVTRWDWSERPAEQYIGIPCGDQWCEVVGVNGHMPSPHYVDAFLPSPLPPGHAVNATHRARVLAIKGWYDEQLLSPATGGAGVTRPTPVWATAVPDPRLDSYTNSHYRPGRWLPAAHVFVAPPASGVATTEFDAYRAKFNFDIGWNTVSLCKRGGSVCVPRQLRQNEEGPSATCATDSPWWAKVVSPTGRVKYMCIHRWQYPYLATGAEISARGAVRWHWKPDDETLWISCVNGCCELDP